MTKERKPYRELVAAFLTGLVALVAGIDALGAPTRLVIVLTIFFGALASGIALARALERIRRNRAAEQRAAKQEQPEGEKK
jgi:uncharacterized membrane protein HdeD (DUF308 family)